MVLLAPSPAAAVATDLGLIKMYMYIIMNHIPIYIGLGVVVSTHVYMLNEAMPESMRVYHAGANLAAAGLIVYGVYF